MRTLADKIKLGNLAEDPTETKDAFHVAGIVLSFKEELEPGTSLKYVGGEEKEGEWGDRYFEDEKLVICDRNDSERQFIVDPFLTKPVPKWKNFWALPVLSSVVNLSHTFQIKGRERVVVELPRGMDEDSISCALQGC